MWTLMNVLLEESPALDLGSVSIRLGATSASAIKVLTSCTSEADINVMMLTSAPLSSTSAAALLDVITYMGPTSVNAKMDTRVTD